MSKVEIEYPILLANWWSRAPHIFRDRTYAVMTPSIEATQSRILVLAATACRYALDKIVKQMRCTTRCEKADNYQPCGVKGLLKLIRDAGYQYQHRRTSQNVSFRFFGLPQSIRSQKWAKIMFICNSRLFC